MALKDAKEFFAKLESDAEFKSRLLHSKTEEETLSMVRDQYHLNFNEREFHSAFMEKYHCPLKKAELHKLAHQGLLSPEIAAKIPFSAQKPRHGE